jgi:hypothetical protein
MEDKIIRRIGLLGEKFGSISTITETSEIPSNLKPFFRELAKDYERQKKFLEEVLIWYHKINKRTKWKF